MSKEARNWAKQQRLADRTLTLVLHAIAWAADKGTGDCRAAQAVIAAEAGVQERAVRYALVVLERLEVISRKPRSKGRFGRTTDLITLALDRNFDISRAAIQAVRKALQPAPRAGSATISNRHRVPLQPAPRAGEYNPVNPEGPYQRGTYLEGCSVATSQDVALPREGARPADRDHLPANVILLSRGAA